MNNVSPRGKPQERPEAWTQSNRLDQGRHNQTTGCKRTSLHWKLTEKRSTWIRSKRKIISFSLSSLSLSSEITAAWPFLPTHQYFGNLEAAGSGEENTIFLKERMLYICKRYSDHVQAPYLAFVFFMLPRVVVQLIRNVQIRRPRGLTRWSLNLMDNSFEAVLVDVLVDAMG